MLKVKKTKASQNKEIIDNILDKISKNSEKIKDAKFAIEIYNDLISYLVINEILTEKEDEKPFNQSEELEKMFLSSNKSLQIMAVYFHKRKYIIDSKEMLRSLVRRNIRAAKSLEVYPIDDIKRTIDWCIENTPVHMLSLEAVGKRIDMIRKLI